MELVQNEIHDQLSRLRTSPGPGLDPDKAVEYHEGRRPRFLANWARWILSTLPVSLLWMMAVTIGIAKGSAALTILGSVVLGGTILLYPVLRVRPLLLRRRYDALLHASTWARWDEALHHIDSLQRLQRWLGKIVPDFELSRQRAQALAGSGRLEDALAEFRKYENDQRLEQWYYLSMLSGIYQQAHDFEKALECSREAFHIKASFAMRIDLVLRLVYPSNQPDEAAALLDGLGIEELPAISQGFLPAARGLIAWRRGLGAEALEHFKVSLGLFQRFAHQSSIEGAILFTQALVCLGHRITGDHAKADALLREVEPFLVATGDEEILRVCRGK